MGLLGKGVAVGREEDGLDTGAGVGRLGGCFKSSNVSIEQDEVVVGLQNDSRSLQFLDNFFIPVVMLVIFPQRTLRTAVLITVTFPRWISTGQSVLWFSGVHCRLQPRILVQAATM